MSCSQCDRPAHAKGLCSMHYKRATSTRPVHPTRDMTDEERFEHYTEKSDGCWLWVGANFGRYGAFYADKRTMGAHQYAYRQTHGEIPKGMFVCHRCDTPLCVNPAHLFLGTPLDNTSDMITKGRGKWPNGETHHLAKLSDQEIREILDLRRMMTQKHIAKLYGVDPSHVSRLISGHKRGRKATHDGSLT